MYVIAILPNTDLASRNTLALSAHAAHLAENQQWFLCAVFSIAEAERQLAPLL